MLEFKTLFRFDRGTPAIVGLIDKTLWRSFEPNSDESLKWKKLHIGNFIIIIVSVNLIGIHRYRILIWQIVYLGWRMVEMHNKC